MEYRLRTPRSTSLLAGLVVKPANIRIWIHDRDIGKLQQLLWEGHGARLRNQTSKYPSVKRLLDSVPFVMVSRVTSYGRRR